jgi:hypothetical protein
VTYHGSGHVHGQWRRGNHRVGVGKSGSGWTAGRRRWSRAYEVAGLYLHLVGRPGAEGAWCRRHRGGHEAVGLVQRKS